MKKYTSLLLILWIVVTAGCIHMTPRRDRDVHDILSATRSRNLEKLEEFIARGDNVNMRDTKWQNYTPLMHAVDKYWIDGIKILINAGADLNAKADKWEYSKTLEGGLTPLHRACYFKSKEMANMLIEAGAGINAKTNSGRTPLMLALADGRLSDVYRVSHQHSKLLSRLYMRNKWYERLFSQIEKPKASLNPLVEEAIANGISLTKVAAQSNVKGADNRTICTVVLLMEAGADPSVRCANGRSAFEYAAAHHRFDELSYMLQLDRSQCVRLKKNLSKRFQKFKELPMEFWEFQDEELQELMMPIDKYFYSKKELFSNEKLRAFHLTSLKISFRIMKYFCNR